jgi:hypothetical protein
MTTPATNLPRYCLAGLDAIADNWCRKAELLNAEWRVKLALGGKTVVE